VFLSVFEHNSNLLPWRETGADIEIVPLTEDGDFDYDFLAERMKIYKDQNRLKIGALSAGSNITGNLFDTDRIALICH
jgi:selenocysteine lyase/cysteine desulfurase